MLIRDIKNASSLFLECVSTFTSTEIISYQELVRYTVLTSMITLDRVNLKKKVKSIVIFEVVHSPDVIG